MSLHGAGKHLAKGEASRILHRLVVEDILVEEVKKSDYGSVSSILKVSLLMLYTAILPSLTIAHCASNVSFYNCKFSKALKKCQVNELKVCNLFAGHRIILRFVNLILFLA